MGVMGLTGSMISRSCVVTVAAKKAPHEVYPHGAMMRTHATAALSSSSVCSVPAAKYSAAFFCVRGGRAPTAA